MEVATLKPEHIDSKTMLIKVEQAKGGKERYTVLSSRLLEELRQYYKTYKPTPTSSPPRLKTTNTCPHLPLHSQHLRRGPEKSRHQERHRHPYPEAQLRHPSSGGRLRSAQNPGAPGHTRLSTTMIYLHVSRATSPRSQAPWICLTPRAQKRRTLPMSPPIKRPKPKLEVADIFRLHIAEYRQCYPLAPISTGSSATSFTAAPRPGRPHRALYPLWRRTYPLSFLPQSTLPQVSAHPRERWLEKRHSELASHPYFHIVFTLPHELNLITLKNKSVMLTSSSKPSLRP